MDCSNIFDCWKPVTEVCLWRGSSRGNREREMETSHFLWYWPSQQPWHPQAFKYPNFLASGEWQQQANRWNVFACPFGISGDSLLICHWLSFCWIRLVLVWISRLLFWVVLLLAVVMVFSLLQFFLFMEGLARILSPSPSASNPSDTYSCICTITLPHGW